MQETVYINQPSFSAGEISEEVASRVDLDKYQSALLTAQNAYIRPYGAVYKRGGTIYCGETKTSGKRVILKEFNSPTGAFLLEIGGKYIRVWKNGVYTGNEVTTPYTEEELTALRFCQSADVMFITSGTHPLMTLNRNSDTNWTFTEYAIKKPYFDESLAYVDGLKIAASAKTGTVTLTASEDFFKEGMVGAGIQLEHEVATATVSHYSDSETSYTSDSVLVGKEWKIHTNKTWWGTIYLDISDDGENWKLYRMYKSDEDANYTESGTVSEHKYMRFRWEVSKGDNRAIDVQLTATSYTHTGYAIITAYTDAKNVTATIKDDFGSTDATDSYAISPWCDTYGYPKCVTFFQDRLCLAGTDTQPHVLWMSRTGDYNNFSVEKTSGTLTDDSAIAISFISRKRRDIKHITPAGSLIILTDGNEWTLDGSSTVTPTKASTRMQTARGCTDVEPISIGNQIVFIQKRGKTVRSFQYDYATDAYDGPDLMLLAKHITRNSTIVDMDYMQDPDSKIYFVLSDGTMAMLSYVADQKVYAWSRMQTEGKIISICDIDGTDKDISYIAVERNGKTFIEQLFGDMHSSDPDDYVMLDSAVILTGSDLTGGTISHLPDTEIDVLADGRMHKGIKTDSEGNFTMDCTASHIIAGLPYTMTLELPDVEMQSQQGSIQGRFKKISAVTLRLKESLGGMAGVDENYMDQIKYDELFAQKIVLYSGDKHVGMPNPGADKDGRVLIKSSDPYPFNLAAVIREVELLER